MSSDALERMVPCVVCIAADAHGMAASDHATYKDMLAAVAACRLGADPPPFLVVEEASGTWPHSSSSAEANRACALTLRRSVASRTTCIALLEIVRRRPADPVDLEVTQGQQA
jgi:hypothetical protein